MTDPKIVFLATELTIAWLENSHTRAGVDDAPAFLRSMAATVEALGSPPPPPGVGDSAATYVPAVSVPMSLANPDFILSMVDGRPYRMLHRHLSSKGLSPAQYRQRYNLPADYPMTAASYSAARSAEMKALGFGLKAAAVTEEVASATAKPVKAAAKGARKGVAEAKKAAQQHLG